MAGADLSSRATVDPVETAVVSLRSPARSAGPLLSAETGSAAWRPSARLRAAAPARARPQVQMLPEPTPLAGMSLAAKRQRAGPQAPSLPQAAWSAFGRSDW